MTYYLIVSAVLFCALAIIWTHKDTFNLMLKMVFIGLDLWAIYMLIGPMNMIATVIKP